VTSLFGRNPIAMIVIGAALVAVGLAFHALLLPWIGGALFVVGGVKTLALLHRRGPADSNGDGRSLR
jgi:membrane protein implicated in regulation of membrane protease activity